MRLVFLGSPPFATPILAGLLASAHRPVAVVTPPDRQRGRGRRVERSPIAELVEHEDIELIQPESARDPDFLDHMRALAPDVCLVASYGELLTEEFLEIPTGVCLNVHGSLLPRHRGASPIQAAILAGDRVTGVSIQRVVLELDAGDVMLERELEILPEETAGELEARLAALATEASLEALELVLSGRARYRPQEPARVTKCWKLRKQHGAIDWSADAAAIVRHVRAMNPWPAAQTTSPDGRGLQVLRAHEAPRPPDLPIRSVPGSLLAVDPGLVVLAGEGAVALDEVKPSGKRAMSATEYQRGARLAPGARLGGD